MQKKCKKTAKDGRIHMKKAVVQGTNFRWVVPRLDPQVWSRKEAYKAEVLDRLLASKTARKGVRYYSIAVESHADGSPHLDLLLIFQKQVRLTYTQLDFLCEKHGDLTRYRSLNRAILQYGSKEDTPLNTCPELSVVLDEDRIRRDQYGFFQEKMIADPFSFNLREYCDRNDLFRKVRNFQSLESTLRKHQEARANSLLKAKPGLRLMPLALIKARTTEAEWAQLTSWAGYFEIVDAINSVALHGGCRPFKSKQLLLVGLPNTGKTTLNRLLGEYVATYEVGVNTWWPRYQDGVYKFFSWNEFTLRKMPYTDLLKLLEGTPLNLEQKGGHGYRADNQLIIMNSNLDAFQHLQKKFGSYRRLDELRAALMNFPARVQELKIPAGKNLFLLVQVIRRLQAEVD